MSEVKLLPHNEKAYNKLINCLEDNQLVSINHATGTGKSFIILKYISENPDKKILYLAPTYPILDQLLHEHTKELGMETIKNVDTMIYRTLLSMDMESLASKYDVIVLDEYHRCGAKKWGKKINELLHSVKTNFLNTKVIGTTATEIRYLDNEKNMNKILFDGVEASRLELSDAILQGILPAPVYITINYNLLEQLYALEKRITRIIVNEEKKRQMLSEIFSLKHALEDLFKIGNLEQYLKPPGKYLVFSSNISSIKDDKRRINKLFEGNEVLNYQIHSYQSHEQNKEELKKFRENDKSKSSVLYSVDILNEGVHVKDIDSIFMLRPTTSPIIYFQQLGRLLSYSSRKDEVVVFDLVNNIKNYPVIYELYESLIKKAKILIEKDPSNKERYENIIKRFKIVDKSTHLYAKIDELQKKYSISNLNKINLLDAVEILEQNNINDIIKMQANMTLFKYQRYITVELFKRISQLQNIEKPKLFSLTLEQFEEYLDGASCIKEKNRRQIDKIYNECMQFIKENNMLPSIMSDDTEEVALANKIFQKIELFTSNQKQDIISNVSDDLSLFEKISYGYIEEEIDYNLLASELKFIFDNPIYINSNISELIRKRLTGYKKNASNEKEMFIKSYDEIYTNLTSDLLDKIYYQNKTIEVPEAIKEELDNLSFNETMTDKKIDQIYFQDYFNQVTNNCLIELKTRSIDEILDELYQELKNFIQLHKREPSYHSTKKNIKKEEYNKILYENELLCKKILFKNDLDKKGYLRRLDDIYLNAITNYNDNVYFEELNLFIDFMNEHNGEMPSSQNPDIIEQRLANKLKNNMKNYSEIVKNMLSDEIVKNIERRNQIFKEYINFVRVNRRKPIILDNEYEIELVYSFNRWYPYFEKEQLAQIKKVIDSISKNEQFERVYAALKESKRGRK
ncbi:MAG: hypothetical protein E7157_00185 [Lactobacillales bacterium]|nr:hypothetical protein [Lactobacillales bacterium]